MSDSLKSLPFITSKQDAEGCENIESFWAPARAADYGADCAAGRTYAGQLVDFIRETGNPTLLPRIIGAMPRGEMSGVEIGFLTALGIAAAT
jgi:hypothetical protein